MIKPVPAPLQGRVVLMLGDLVGGTLTVNKTNGLCGLAINDCEGDTAGFVLDRADRATLIKTLIELQEDENLE